MEIKQVDKALRSRAVSYFLLMALSCCGAITARAQGTTPQRGYNPGGSYALTEIEAVNTVNGNLMLHIPLASLPAGRGGMLANLGLIYNSKLWDTPSVLVPDPMGSATPQTRFNLKASLQGGWRYGVEYKLQLISRLDEEIYNTYAPNCERDAQNHTQYSTRIWKLQVIFPDGSTHELVPLGYEYEPYTYGDGYYNIRPDGRLIRCDCHNYIGLWECSRLTDLVNTGTITYYTTDGTFLKLQIPHDDGTGWYNKAWTLYLPDGGRVTGNGITDTYGSGAIIGPERIYDRNNNYVEIQHTTYNSHRADKIVDQFDRSILIEYDSAPNQDTVYATGAAGVPLVWQVNWKTIYVRKTAYTDQNSTAYTQELNQILRVVDRIVLPAQAGGLTYAFTYNGGPTDDYPNGGTTYGWGELSSITLPSGAKADYAYRQDNVNVAHWYEVLQNHPVDKVLTYSADYDSNSTQVTESWHYSFNFYYHTSTSTLTAVTAPDGGLTTDEIKYDPAAPYAFDNAISFRTTRPDGSVVERLWRPNSSSTGGGARSSNNAYVKTEFISVKDAAGNLSKTAIKDFSYDKNGNVTRIAEYDWVAYSDVPRTNPGFGITGQPTGIPPGAPLKRVTVNRYYAPTPDASDVSTADPNSYYYTTSPRLRDAIQSSEIWGASAQVSRTEFTYDDPSTTGNMTLQRNWDSTKGPPAGLPQDPFRLDATNSISARQEYDDNTTNPALRFGNVTLSVDANGNRLKYTYGAVTRPDGVVFTGLYPTTAVIAEGTTVQHTTSNIYDYWSGLVTRATDEDNQVSTSTTYDAFGRPTLVEEADEERDSNNVSLERRTVTEYSDPLRRVIMRSDLSATGDGKRVSIQHYDPLGRVRLSRTLEEDSSLEAAENENVGVKVQTRYLINGATHARYQLTSNPYRAARSSDAGVEETMGWALTISDQGGRLVRLESFGGAALPAPWGTNSASTGAVRTTYDAEKTTVTDQADKTRQGSLDGLGRLAQVIEAPGATGYGFVTSYDYDALGNLTQVSQGEQTRTFVYSSLSRLTSATNPEGGTVSYSYDMSGNLVLKVDPRTRPGSATLPNCSVSYTGTSIATCYEYDPLGRVKSRTYNDGTPSVAYTYDTAVNGRGRLASVDNGVSAYRYASYDPLGRVKSSSQTTGNVTYSMPDYQYDIAGNVTSEQYPSGRVVKTEYDGSGRVAGVKNPATGLYYAGASPTDPNNRIQYTAGGATSSVKLGSGLWEHTSFNSRLQPTQIGLGVSAASSTMLRLDYTYGTDSSHNNGNVRTQTITVPGMTQPYVQTYGYDELNRLNSAEERNDQISATVPTWKQVYYYDRYGNRTLTNGTSYPAQLDAVNNPSVSPGNNRINSAGYSYDDAGNLTAMPVNSQTTRVLAYDAENHQVKVDGGAAAGGADYVYDGSGRRVKKVAGPVTTVYVYDAAGRLVAEYGGAPPQTFGTSYVTQDTLGSTRLITGQNSSDVRGRYDYLPFGEEVYLGRSNYGGGNDVKQRFASKERDEETGLDYVGARYYASTRGRFTSIDPAMIKARTLLNPQDLNRYAYVANNPLAYVDPNGREKVEIIIRTFIPYPSIQYPPTVVFNGNTDNNGHRLKGKEGYKTEQRVSFETDPNRPGASFVEQSKSVGNTRRTALEPQTLFSGGMTIMIPVTREAQASGDTLKLDITRTNEGMLIHVKGNESNPLATASPGITFDFNILVKSEGPTGRLDIKITGTHDGFPAYEVEVRRPEAQDQIQIIPIHDPRQTGEGPTSLFPPSEHDVHIEDHVNPPPPPRRQ